MATRKYKSQSLRTPLCGEQQSAPVAGDNEAAVLAALARDQSKLWRGTEEHARIQGNRFANLAGLLDGVRDLEPDKCAFVIATARDLLIDREGLQ